VARPDPHTIGSMVASMKRAAGRWRKAQVTLALCVTPPAVAHRR